METTCERAGGAASLLELPSQTTPHLHRQAWAVDLRHAGRHYCLMMQELSPHHLDFLTVHPFAQDAWLVLNLAEADATLLLLCRVLGGQEIGDGFYLVKAELVACDSQPAGDAIIPVAWHSLPNAPDLPPSASATAPPPPF